MKLLLFLVSGYPLIGPIIFNFNLNAARFLQLLQEQIMPAVRASVGNFGIPMHDCCPARNAVVVKKYLEENFPNRLIANSVYILWPAGSPDINPLDVFL